MINQEHSEWYRNFYKAWCHERETQREREKAYNPCTIDDPFEARARKTVIFKAGADVHLFYSGHANQKT